MQDMAEFSGGVFTSAIGGGRAGARISFSSDSLIATTSDGELFRVRFSDCQLELGGASGRMWFCRTPDRSLTIFCEAAGFAAALQQKAPRELGAKLAAVLAETHARASHTRLVWAAVVAALLTLLGGGYFAIGHLGRMSVDVLPRSLDEKIGELASAQLTLEGSVVDDPVLNKAVKELVARLAPHAGSDFKYRVRIVDAPIVNAFALPGGSIVLYTGLLRAAKSPEQVAGVLAHEMAHVQRRHHMQRIMQAVGVIAGVQLLFGDVSGVAAIAVEVLQKGAINSYSREQEHEADMDGVQTLARAEIDPNALADFFVLLEKREGGLPTEIAWLGTHPDLHQRVLDVRALAKRVAPKHTRPFTFVWSQVQRHAGQVQDEPATPTQP